MNQLIKWGLFRYILTFCCSLIIIVGRSVYADIPSWRWDHVMAFDSNRGVAVIQGGYISNYENSGETWEWDGYTWELKSESGPGLCGQQAMVYDTQRKVVVLFSGWSENMTNKVWEWDGISWILVHDGSGNAPQARYNHAMAYDEASGMTLLFGGYGLDGTPNLPDTWGWNGNTKTWELLNEWPEGARRGHTMVYDSVHQKTVMFGGFNGSRLNDSYTWNSTLLQWENTGYTGPSGRYDHVMSFDKIRGISVMYGGFNGNYETWELNLYSGWVQPPIETHPNAGDRSAMAYDSIRGVSVLHGGDGGGDETWEWDGESWKQRKECTLELSYVGECPGQIDLTVSNATPCGKIALVYGFKAGMFTVPGSTCPGIVLDIKPPYHKGAPLILTDDDCDGIVTVSGNVPAVACGKLLLQAVDLETCCVSNLITIE